jgi:hypothetical protein
VFLFVRQLSGTGEILRWLERVLRSEELGTSR